MIKQRHLSMVEERYLKVIEGGGVNPILPKDMYFRVMLEEGGKTGEKIAQTMVGRIRKKLGEESIVNRRGFCYLSQENFQKGLERIWKLSSVEKE